MKKEALLTKNSDHILLVDIREDYEVAKLPPLPNAVHIPLSRLPNAVAHGTLPTNKTIITVCMTGGRCHAANSFLAANGFQTDFLEGGMLGLQ